MTTLIYFTQSNKLSVKTNNDILISLDQIFKYPLDLNTIWMTSLCYGLI